MAFLSQMRASRLNKFLLAHAIVAALAAAYVFDKQAHMHGPAFFPYMLTLVQVYLGSFAGALLSIVQLIDGLARGFAGMGSMVLLAHPVPMPVIAGVAGVGAFILMVTGIKMYRSKMGYVVMVLGSLLFITSAYVYFVDMGGNVKATLDPSLALQTER